ncbi:hypothetical protein [Kitasatospora sp. NPDC058478]|uniref:hypothetical protein n=1 Tax=unclassified Kitasatospora TaxID=2633591 RepID=UPI003669B6AC
MSTVSRHGLTRCALCLETVRTTITQAARRQLVNPEPDVQGNVVARLDHTGTWRSRVPTDDRPQEPYERRFMPHAATCSRAPRPVSQTRLPEGVASLDAQRRRRERTVPHEPT